MAYRSPYLQTIHDRVIEVASSNLQAWTVYTNPGQQKNAYIGTAYPDIILANKNTNYIEYVIEVETAETVIAHEAANQWKAYSQLPGTFYLLVPRETRQNAGFLCIQYGIQAKFATYWIDSNNNIQIQYE